MLKSLNNNYIYYTVVAVLAVCSISFGALIASISQKEEKIKIAIADQAPGIYSNFRNNDPSKWDVNDMQKWCFAIEKNNPGFTCNPTPYDIVKQENNILYELRKKE